MPLGIDDMEVYEGAMLSDASFVLRKKAVYFTMCQAGRKHQDWLDFIKDALQNLGFCFSDNMPRSYPLNPNYLSYKTSILRSLSSPSLEEEYYRWYRRDHYGKFRKVVPDDLDLTPVVLANWFMGDGTSSWYKASTTSVPVTLCTNSFDLRSLVYLQSGLRIMGITTYLSNAEVTKRGAGMVISIRQESVNKFMDYVEPYVLPSYAYKIKRKSPKR